MTPENENGNETDKENQVRNSISQIKPEANGELEEAFHQNSSDLPKEEMVFKEGGWGWVVVVAASYSFGILIGMNNNYALVYNKLDIVYQGTDNHTLFAGLKIIFLNSILYFYCRWQY